MANSTDTPYIFLTTFSDIWKHLTIWTMASVAVAFFIAGVVACRVGKTRYKWTWLPLLMLVVGAIVGFTEGAIAGAMLAAIYRSIPYEIGIDVAAGLGIGQAIVIVYLHLGRADFIHR